MTNLHTPRNIPYLWVAKYTAEVPDSAQWMALQSAKTATRRAYILEFSLLFTFGRTALLVDKNEWCDDSCYLGHCWVCSLSWHHSRLHESKVGVSLLHYHHILFKLTCFSKDISSLSLQIDVLLPVDIFTLELHFTWKEKKVMGMIWRVELGCMWPRN